MKYEDIQFDEDSPEPHPKIGPMRLSILALSSR